MLALLHNCPNQGSPVTFHEGLPGLESSTTALVFPDKPLAIWSCGTHLPPPQLWLPPQALLGFLMSQVILRGAHLPLEAERGQAGLKNQGHQCAQHHCMTKVSHPSCQGGTDCWAVCGPVLCHPCPQLSGASAGPAGAYLSHLLQTLRLKSRPGGGEQENVGVASQVSQLVFHHEHHLP